MKKQERQKKSLELKLGSLLEFKTYKEKEKTVCSDPIERLGNSTHAVVASPTVSTLSETMNDFRDTVTAIQSGVEILKWMTSSAAPYMGAVVHTASTLLKHLDK